MKRSTAIPEKEGLLSRNKYEAGDFVSADQFVVNTPGRLLNGFGKESSREKLHGGTIFQDAATGIIWVECQVLLGAGGTLMSKMPFEEWLWEVAAAEISHLHSDNGIFTSNMFRLIANRSINLRVSLVLAQNIKMQWLSAPYRLSPTWPGPSWFMFLFIGLNEESMT